jgi:DNA-binding GntR family transcriptional regulator
MRNHGDDQTQPSRPGGARRRSASHATIREVLRRDIHENRLRPGDQLPTEFELVERFGVSRHTVRSALQQLANEGLIFRRAGHGTFVTPYATDPANAQLVGDDKHMFGLASWPPVTVVQPARLLDDPIAARRLGAATETVLQLSFVRCSKGQPIGFWVISLPAELLEPIAGALAALDGGSATVVGIVERVSGRLAVRADQDLSAEAASPDVADVLAVGINDPLLRAERTYYDDRDQPLQYVLVRYVPAHFSYRLHVLRHRS